jgi:hypothetical protein
MRIIKFVVENYKALKGKHEFNTKGLNFMLLGNNGKGKTSAGRAIMDVLTKNFPSRPISDGENQGFLEFELSDGRTLLARFSENGKNKIELLSEDGLPMSTPKELFTALAGDGMSFNIDQFLTLAPKPKRELLEKIAGLDLSELNEKEKQAFTERTDANATLKAAKARALPYDKKLAELKDINTKEASEELERMVNHNATFQRGEAAKKDFADKISASDQKILDLQAQIKVEEQNKITLTEKLDAANKWLNENPVIPEEDIEAIRTQINQATEIMEAKKLAKEHQTLKEAEDEAKRLDELVKEIREQKEAKIKAAQLPAEGLSFDPDGEGLLLDGFPFESNQISESRKLIAGVQLAASMLGEIRFLHFDGAKLDKNSAEHILQWAEKNDLQLCLERPIWDEMDGVRMELIEEVSENVAFEAQSKKETVKEPIKKAESKTDTSKATGKSMPWDAL